MPIKRTKSGKYKFGDSGHEYPTKTGAAKQMRAMYASGYKGDKDEKKKKKKSTRKVTKKPTI